MKRAVCLRRLFPLVVLFFLIAPITLFSQGDAWLQEEIRFKSAKVSIAEGLQLLIDEGISISYRSDKIPEMTIVIKGRKQSIRKWLKVLLGATDLTYETVGEERSLVIFPDPSITGVSRTLYGNIYDALSGERLILANIYIRNRDEGVSTNEDGRYAIHLPGGYLNLLVSYIGYRTQDVKLILRSDTLFEIAMYPDLNLQEITVTARTESMIGVNPDAGGIRIGVTETEQISGLGGEADPLQVAALLPGITTGADGVGGINIRGSDASQNLILLDGVPVYNLSHAGGLFSIFNTQAIRRVDLYKNGLPTRFGGRLSGVLDVHTRDGNLYRNELRVSQSLLASRITAEGPLIPDVSSFLVSGRYFWAGALVPGLSRKYKRNIGREGEANYNLYDLNFKLNHTLSKTDRLHFSFYKGLDAFRNSGKRRQQLTVLGDASQVFEYDITAEESQEISWGNSVGAFRWNHIFNERLFTNLSLTYSNLGLGAGFVRKDSFAEPNTNVLLESLAAAVYRSDIRQVGIAFDGQWLPQVGQEIRFGTQLNLHRFRPLLVTSQSIDITDDSFELPEIIEHEPVEVNGYLAYVLRRPDLQFRIGLRGQYWHNSDGSNYFTLSPRLLYTRRLSSTISWQSTIDVTAQAVHLLGSASIGLPTDIWVPSTQDIAPSRAYQGSTAFKWRFWPKWELEVAGYVKRMENLVEYLGRESLDGAWEDQISIGSGDATGLEFTLRRNEGKFRGWIAYTRANTNRNFDERVNFGNTFPYRYDRRHSISSLISWHPGPRSSLSLTWRFGTGAAYSFSLNNFDLPIEQEPADPSQFFSIVTSRNGFRLPPVHRLDVNYSFELRQKANSAFTHSFDIGLYNAYDRHNEIFYDLRTEYSQSRGELVAEQGFVKVFIAPILPIFSYQLHFRGKHQLQPKL